MYDSETENQVDSPETIATKYEPTNIQIGNTLALNAPAWYYDAMHPMSPMNQTELRLGILSEYRHNASAESRGSERQQSSY